MIGFLSGIWGKVVGVAVAIGAFLILIAKIKQSGRDAERADNSVRVIKTVEKKNEVEKRVDRLSDNDVADELFDKYSRD